MRAFRLLCLATLAALPVAGGAAQPPDVLLVSIDTLRADHLSSYGYHRPTSPAIDQLLAGGVRFVQARTVEPLTAPAFASMLTSLHPHEHGLTRNGLGVRPNLASFSRLMSRRGYETAAFVGNWTLKPELAGLDEHFDVYEAILTRKRWFGLAKSEATADDVSEAALEWLEDHLALDRRQPFLLWVHYVEPHAPYRAHKEHLRQIGLKPSGSFFSPRKRYDSEIAFVDARVGDLLQSVRRLAPGGDLLTVFLSDHGESLGEHGYWGHGRHLFEDTLWIPMGLHWPGRIAPGTVEAPASILDLAPTLLTLIGLPSPSLFRGFDWAPVLRDGGSPPNGRVTFHQAHRSSVEAREDNRGLRRRGLLEVARIEAGAKEIFRAANGRRWLFDLREDPDERASPVDDSGGPSAPLAEWLEEVRSGLAAADSLPPPTLTDEDLAALRALGYID